MSAPTSPATTLAIRARVPLDVLRDTIQPFPTLELYIAGLATLQREMPVAGAVQAIWMPSRW